MYKLLEVKEIIYFIFSNANERMLLIYASKHGSLSLIYQLYLGISSLVSSRFSVCEIVFYFMLCLRIFSSKIVWSYLAEIGRGLKVCTRLFTDRQKRSKFFKALIRSPTGSHRTTKPFYEKHLYF